MQCARIYKVIAIPEMQFDEYLEKEIISRGWKIVSVAPYSFKKSHMTMKIEQPGEGMDSMGHSSFDLAVDSWLIVYDDGE
jgi:hypothetical protein